MFAVQVEKSFRGPKDESNQYNEIHDAYLQLWREQHNFVAVGGWVFHHYLGLIGKYMKSRDEYPNPAPVYLTEFKK